MIRARVLVVSDSISAGVNEDQSGREAAAALQSVAEVQKISVVPDDYIQVRNCLIDWCDGGADVIFTIGGTGLSPRDVTPEATRSVIEREVPALICALVMNGLAVTPRAMLSRAVAGQRGQCLIINLPGSPSAVRESIEVLKDVLSHAIKMMHGGGHARTD